jgi:phosphatidylglycerol:prolipoprotein diacylglycerol transferase
MIPYFTVPPIAIGPLVLSPFRLLVVLAVVAGYIVYVRRLNRKGIPNHSGRTFFASCVIAGFLVGHVAKLALYTPAVLIAEPWRLLQPFNGMSSFGGLFGSFAGGWVWMVATHFPGKMVPALVDAGAFAFPHGWLFGRLACAISHDHVGRLTDHWLGVRYPDGTRWNLGLVEVLFTIGLIVLFRLLDRRPRPAWFFGTTFCFVYAIFRFVLDGLHETAPRLVFDVTVDRACAVALVGMGIFFAVITRMSQRPGYGKAVPQ